MSGSTSKRYPAELRERAVRMVAEIRGEHESEWAAMTHVARLLGVGTPETVRKWLITDEGVGRPARRWRDRGRGLPRMEVLTLPIRKTSTCPTLPSPVLT